MAGEVAPTGWTPERGDPDPVCDVSSLCAEPLQKRVRPLMAPAMSVVRCEVASFQAGGDPIALHNEGGGFIPLPQAAGGNPPASEIAGQSSIGRSQESSMLLVLQAELLLNEQMLLEEEQRSRTVSLRTRLVKVQNGAASSTRSRDSRQNRTRRPPSVFTRSGRNLRELDVEVREKVESDSGGSGGDAQCSQTCGAPGPAQGEGSTGGGSSYRSRSCLCSWST
jgi:hypothetical protein